MERGSFWQAGSPVSWIRARARECDRALGLADLRGTFADRLRDLVTLALAEPIREHLGGGEVAVEHAHQAPRLRRTASDRQERLVDLDRVLDVVRLEPVQAESDRLHTVPETSGLFEFLVA